MVGLPVQAVVWTQKGQCAEMPSRLSLAFAKVSLISLADLKPLLGLEHEVGGLRAGGAGLLGVIQELRETLGAVLGAFDTGMETIFGHNVLGS